LSFETLTIEADPRGVARLTLRRPEKHNAMNAAMISELRDALARVRGDGGIRVVVLTGAGNSFCAGGDLEWMRTQASADRPTRIAQARELALMLKDLNELPKPVIGRINGAAYGGGVGLAAVCDIVVASDAARFGLTEVRLGLIPATIGPYVVARLGEGHARRVFFSGRLFDAEEAKALGLVGRIVPGADLDAAIDEDVRPFLDAAPGAVARAKALVRELGGSPDSDVVERTIAHLADTWETAEASEGLSAFFEKRAAAWMPSKPSR
jgi:methylglutaconyl-CoA hydratase